MNQLFKISKEFEDKRKNYIVGTGRFALLQFTTLLQENVYVSGFCTFDTSTVGMEVMNKKVFDINDFKNDSESNFIIAEENHDECESKVKALGIKNTWIDIRMFSLINDCVWTFM